MHQVSYLIYSINQEKRITDVYKQLFKAGNLSQQNYNKLRPVGSRPGILYGLCKVHKACVDNCPPFRPILSAIGTPTYKLAKYLVPILSHLTTN